MKPVKTIDKTLMTVFGFFLLVSFLSLFIFFIKFIRIDGYTLDPYIYMHIGSYNIVDHLQAETRFFSIFDVLTKQQEPLVIIALVTGAVEFVLGGFILVFAKKTDNYDNVLRILKYVFVGLGVVVSIMFVDALFTGLLAHGGDKIEINQGWTIFVD